MTCYQDIIIHSEIRHLFRQPAFPESEPSNVHRRALDLSKTPKPNMQQLRKLTIA
jgi:hypothetical protein